MTRKNLKIFLFSFIFAFFTWLYISLIQIYNTELSVPLKVKMTEKQAITTEIPKEINLVIRGKGWDLLGILVSKKVEYVLDLTNYKKDTRINIMQSAGEVLNLPLGVSIVNIYPDALDITFDNITEKIVKVQNNVRVTTKDGYIIVGSPLIEPDSIMITGATSVLSKIKYIPTENVVLENLNSKITKSVKLKDTLSNLIFYEQKTVNITYNIQLSADKEFDNISVNLINEPGDKEVLIIPPKIKLTLRGGVDDLAKVTSEDLSVSIDYKSLLKDTTGFVIPDIKMPLNLDLLKFEPEKFQYIIKAK